MARVSSIHNPALAVEYDEVAHTQVAEAQATLGREDYQIATEIGISALDLKVWCQRHPELEEAITRGRTAYFAWCLPNVEKALREQAMKGNMQAIKFLLTNAEPDKWKERQTHEVSQVSAAEYATELNEAVARLAEAKRKAILGTGLSLPCPEGEITKTEDQKGKLSAEENNQDDESSRTPPGHDSEA